MHRILFVVCGCSLLLGLGCQGSKDTPPQSNQTAEQSNSDQSTELIRGDDPQQLTQDFLTALFAGQTQRATAMLTVKAQQASREAGIEIESPGSPTAQFEVTEAEIVSGDPNSAEVWSVITDAAEGQQQEPYNIVWLLSKESSGWAVSGMATVLFDHQFILNFEDARDVLAKRQWAQQQAQLEHSARQHSGSEALR